MAEVEKSKMQPDSLKGNIGSSTVNISMDKQDFTLKHMSITFEMAAKIDSYFSMYGYKVNSVETPSTISRSQWNYIKTIDVNIKGNIPMNDMQRLKQMYNDGVTFWHNPANVCNYSLTNSIV